MSITDCRDLNDEALERLLIERWLYRGILLAVILLAAIITSYLGIRGIADRADQITVGALLALALAAAGVAFTMPLVQGTTDPASTAVPTKPSWR